MSNRLAHLSKDELASLMSRLRGLAELSAASIAATRADATAGPWLS